MMDGFIIGWCGGLTVAAVIEGNPALPFLAAMTTMFVALKLWNEFRGSCVKAK